MTERTPIFFPSVMNPKEEAYWVNRHNDGLGDSAKHGDLAAMQPAYTENSVKPM